jgi:hypothetical protein
MNNILYLVYESIFLPLVSDNYNDSILFEG